MLVNESLSHHLLPEPHKIHRSPCQPLFHPLHAEACFLPPHSVGAAPAAWGGRACPRAAPAPADLLPTVTSDMSPHLWWLHLEFPPTVASGLDLPTNPRNPFCLVYILNDFLHPVLKPFIPSNKRRERCSSLHMQLFFLFWILLQSYRRE